MCNYVCIHVLRASQNLTAVQPKFSVWLNASKGNVLDHVFYFYLSTYPSQFNSFEFNPGNDRYQKATPRTSVVTETTQSIGQYIMKEAALIFIKF